MKKSTNYLRKMSRDNFM